MRAITCDVCRKTITDTKPEFSRWTSVRTSNVICKEVKFQYVVKLLTSNECLDLCIDCFAGAIKQDIPTIF